MNNYEGLFIIKPELKEEDTKNVIKSISDAIAKGGGAIKKEDNWGKKQLAYPVKKSKDGYYYKVEFDLDPTQVSKIETTYRLNTDILRTMITRK